MPEVIWVSGGIPVTAGVGVTERETEMEEIPVGGPERAGTEAEREAGTEEAVDGVDVEVMADPVEVTWVDAPVVLESVGTDEDEVWLLEATNWFCRLWARCACLDLLSAVTAPSCSAKSKKPSWNFII